MKVDFVYNWRISALPDHLRTAGSEKAHEAGPQEIHEDTLQQLLDEYDVMLVRRTPTEHKDKSGKECPTQPRKKRGYTPPKFCETCGMPNEPAPETHLYLDEKNGRFRQR